MSKDDGLECRRDALLVRLFVFAKLVLNEEFPTQQVRFVPGQQNKLMSASIDGLICTFDISGELNDYDHLGPVINVETTVGKTGFFGPAYEKLWCLTQIETLSNWNLKDSSVEANFEDAHLLASYSWAMDRVLQISILAIAIKCASIKAKTHLIDRQPAPQSATVYYPFLHKPIFPVVITFSISISLAFIKSFGKHMVPSSPATPATPGPPVPSSPARIATNFSQLHALKTRAEGSEDIARVSTPSFYV